MSTAHCLSLDRLLSAGEKLHQARRILMLPRRPADALAKAFIECTLGLPRECEVQYEPARDWIRTILRTMDTSGIKLETAWDQNHGPIALKIESLLRRRARRHKGATRRDECAEFCDALDALANWISRQIESACLHRALGSSTSPETQFAFEDQVAIIDQQAIVANSSVVRTGKNSWRVAMLTDTDPLSTK